LAAVAAAVADCKSGWQPFDFRYSPAGLIPLAWPGANTKRERALAASSHFDRAINTGQRRVFKQPEKSVADFAFGEKVASVFDDMLLRSVPFYEEIQRMIAELAADFAVDGTNVYDLGCSTGTTLIHLGSQLPQRVKFIGVDNSAEMLKRCRQKLTEHRFKRSHELVCADLNETVPIENASVVLMVLTLQFIRPFIGSGSAGSDRE
jgi:tRNA (cmo5U34)-methyltransferase